MAMAIEQQIQRTTDLLVLLMSDDPALMRDAYTVAEAARYKGYTSTVIRVQAGDSDERILKHLHNHGSKLAALGLTSRSLDRSMGAAEAVMRSGMAPVVLFGRDLALASERRKVPVEAAVGVVVGDPAPAVVDMLHDLGNGSSRPIAGLDRLDGDYRPRPPDGGHDRWPFPQFREADLFRLRREGLPMRISRGCPRRCAYCAEQPLEGKHRSRPAHAVVEEMQFHFKHNDVRRFHFVDLVINADTQHLEAICDLLLERDMAFEWWGRALVDPAMPRSLYRKMRLAGCIGLDFDVVSGSEQILHTISAGFTAEQAAEALERASAAGINTTVSVLVGLPGEAELEFGATAAWLYENRYNISQVKDILPCVLQEGSALARNVKQFAITLPAEDPLLNWHNAGFNTHAYRNKRAREMRVFVEDKLHLQVVGQALPIHWDAETRAVMAERILDSANISLAETGTFKERNLHLAGVIKGQEALAGPYNLEIDLTNNCNQHCAGCWIHCLMLKDKRISGDKRRATLDYGSLQRLITSAKQMGANKIQLSGAGEPFMHPRIDDVLELIKDQGYQLNIITNFTLVDADRARNMVDLGVDEVTVSFWAGTPETYVKTHPTAKESLFKQVVEVVSHMTWYRRATGANKPRVKIYNVISALNAHEIDEMISVAREMGADLIEFTPIDVIPGYTDSLALTEEDTRKIIETLMNVRGRPDYLQRTAEEVTEGRVPGLDEQGEFARFLQEHRLPGDFNFSLSDIRRWETYCRRGVHCCRVYEEIHRDSAIFFSHPAHECRECMAFVDCSIDPITLNVRAPYLSLQGFGSFWRRVAGGGEAEDGKRDAQIVDKIPCAIGYTYARVQATGDVIPCCKAADFPLGNILESSFEEVWHGEPYHEFRTKALVTRKSDPYFEPMDCYKVCDNLGHNMTTSEEIESMHARCKEKLLEDL
jgi:MoaA/NifB/PqqE/SkfB family radical SAM enzyme